MYNTCNIYLKRVSYNNTDLINTNSYSTYMAIRFNTQCQLAGNAKSCESYFEYPRYLRFRNISNLHKIIKNPWWRPPTHHLPPPPGTLVVQKTIPGFGSYFDIMYFTVPDCKKYQENLWHFALGVELIAYKKLSST